MAGKTVKTDKSTTAKVETIPYKWIVWILIGLGIIALIPYLKNIDIGDGEWGSEGDRVIYNWRMSKIGVGGGIPKDTLACVTFLNGATQILIVYKYNQNRSGFMIGNISNGVYTGNWVDDSGCGKFRLKREKRGLEITLIGSTKRDGEATEYPLYLKWLN